MKSELVQKAELEAREACEGLGYTDVQLQDFIEWHVSNELERDADRARDLGKPKRNADLTNAIINIAVDPWRRVADEVFPTYGTKHSAYISDEELMAANYERKRNRFET